MVLLSSISFLSFSRTVYSICFRARSLRCHTRILLRGSSALYVTGVSVGRAPSFRNCGIARLFPRGMSAKSAEASVRGSDGSDRQISVFLSFGCAAGICVPAECVLRPACSAFSPDEAKQISANLATFSLITVHLRSCISPPDKHPEATTRSSI